MEQPPGSLDDLQPQDLSTSSISTVIDLTRKGEECVLNATSIDGLRVVKSPSWFQNSGTGNPGLAFSETGSSDVTLSSGEHIQPDNAFSHTTVTLSYVSRSHVFSTPDSLSPPISRFALHPLCDSDKGLAESGYLLNQHYLERVEGPVDLAAQPELLQSLSQAYTGPEDGGDMFLTQDVRELNGGAVSSGGDVENGTQGEEEVESSGSWENCRGLENGQADSRSSAGVCNGSSPETLVPAAVEDEEQDGSDVVFLMSNRQDPTVAMDAVAAKDSHSLNREYVSPLEDPVSPSATSLDDVEDEFLLPQASSSPSGDNSYLETAEDAALDGLSTNGTIELSFDTSANGTRLDSSCENEPQVLRQKAPVELIDLTEDDEKPATVVPHMNGNVKALQRTLSERKLPVRSGRGMRLEAIVMNINSSKYKVSGCIRTKKKARASPSTASNSNVARPKRKNNNNNNNNNNQKVSKRRSRARASLSVKTTKQKSGTPVKRDKNLNANTDSKDSTSDSEILSSPLKSHSSTPQKSPPFSVHKKRSRKELDGVSHSESSPEKTPTRSRTKRSSQSCPHSAVNKTNLEPEPSRLSPPPSPPPPPPSSNSPKKSRGKAKSQAAENGTPPTAKTKAARTPKRRRNKPRGRQLPPSSMFSPKEPEIKLKYVNYKEEKRDPRLDGFSPFIHLERRQSSPSLCTVINYPEEVRTQPKKGQQPQLALSTDFISAAIPSTSCVQLGRASTRGQHQRAFVCCLCGQSANAMDLGDLHGPYYPEGYQKNAKTPASTSGLKEDGGGGGGGYSDTDSSSCSVRRRTRRKRAVPPALRSFRTGAQLKQSQRWSGGDGTDSPAAKRAHSVAGGEDIEDWYSAPVLLLEPCEYWLHEDCAIWSAGVFLVKGKVYGLEEAVKAAHETVCSACRDPGASLGCFFKGCPNKYHYRCALESECVLIEENFSMKCKKHKNKTLKGASGTRWDDR
uniref:transcription factor 20 isoform X2 n=1 Tax=Solea senegalensis TaxID=28829 RepID=UPI001CD86FE0|nr:transcription factor 20 isoform X2 [Solea senegalensis]